MDRRRTDRCKDPSGIHLQRHHGTRFVADGKILLGRLLQFNINCQMDIPTRQRILMFQLLLLEAAGIDLGRTAAFFTTQIRLSDTFQTSFADQIAAFADAQRQSIVNLKVPVPGGIAGVRAPSRQVTWIGPRPPRAGKS